MVRLSDHIITVLDPGNTIEIRPERKVVQVASPGPPGPAGTPGPMGPTGGEHFVYDRNGVPAATWIIQHNLGRAAHVSIISDTGDLVYADIDHTDLNNLIATFAAPFSGKAFIG